MVGIHGSTLAKGFKMKVAITLQGATTKAAEGLAGLKEKLRADAVNSAWGNRLEQVETFLGNKSKTVDVQISEARAVLMKELSEHCEHVRAQLPELPMNHEAQFMKKMKGLSA